ncbi:MAG: hypothetical protein RLY14_43 [Planctomycetota bacterium]
MLIQGRVHQGTIRRGIVFTGVEDISAGVPTVKLRVDKIVAYCHSLDDLPEGMTGELHLTGDGMETLPEIKCPFTLIGLD